MSDHGQKDQKQGPLSNDERVRRMADGKERAKKQREEEARLRERRRAAKAVAQLEYERQLENAEGELGRFQLHYDMLTALLTELRDFARRKQDGPLTAVKIEMINRRLDELQDILKDEEIFPYLEKLDSDRLPSNSDVVMILGQYKVALQSFARPRYQFNPRSKNLGSWSLSKSFIYDIASAIDGLEDEDDYDDEDDEQ